MKKRLVIKKIFSFALSIAVLCTVVTAGAAQSNSSLRTNKEQVHVYQDAAVVQRTQPSRYAASSFNLPSNASAAKAVIANALLKGQQQVDLTSYQITKDQFLNIVNYIIFTEYPQISDIESYEYQLDLSDLIHAVKFNYNYTQTEIQARSVQLNQAMDAVLASTVSSGMTDLQKIVAVHDYLVLNCAYDYQGILKNNISQDSFNAYGVLVKKVAVCQGYAAAFQMMMNKLGIPSIVVQSQAMNHAWNMVNYQGDWYHVDATWDDPIPDRPGIVARGALMQSDYGIAGTENRHYSWDSAGYTATNTQFDNPAFDWSPYFMAKSAVVTGVAVDTKSYSGTVGSVYQFLAKPYVPGTQIKVSSSNPKVAVVERSKAKDSRGVKYTIKLLAPGTATILVTSTDGGLRTVTVTSKAASKAA